MSICFQGRAPFCNRQHETAILRTPNHPVVLVSRLNRSRCYCHSSVTFQDTDPRPNCRCAGQFANAYQMCSYRTRDSKLCTTAAEFPVRARSMSALERSFAFQADCKELISGYPYSYRRFALADEKSQPGTGTRTAGFASSGSHPYKARTN
jgi:hypothetical protein